MKSAASGVLAAVALVLAGCFDFVEPDLPEAGAPAVLQTNLYLDETGHLRADALLVTALTDEGLERTVPDDTLRISGFAIAPHTVRRNGTREYSLNTMVANPLAVMTPLRLTAPAVTGVRARPPAVGWFGLLRADPDTLVVGAGEELVLHLIVEPGESQPAPDQRQWTLEIVTGQGTFRIGAPGLPPATIRVPGYWIPAAPNGRVSAYLTYVLGGTYRPAPGDYIILQTANFRIKWNIRLSASP